jgi:peptidoglycan hydrolase CwlO-like protein
MSKVKAFEKLGANQLGALMLFDGAETVDANTLSAKGIQAMRSLLKYDLVTDTPFGDIKVYEGNAGLFYYLEDQAESVGTLDDSSNLGDEIDSNTTGFVDIVESYRNQIEAVVAELMEAQADIRWYERRLAKRDKQIRKIRKALKS